MLDISIEECIQKMKKLIVIFLIIFMGINIISMAQTTENLIDWAEIWNNLDEDQKTTLWIGTVAGNLMNIIRNGMNSMAMQNTEIAMFVFEDGMEITEYISFFDAEADNLNKSISALDAFYKDKLNKYCNPASLFWLYYLKCQGRDITEELENLRYFSSTAERFNEEKTTMDTLYENVEKSMKDEDIELMQELTGKAIGLLPKNEREQLIGLQTRFNKYGYSALTENETFLMQELNNKAVNLLPKTDRVKLDSLLKKLYNSLTE